MTPWWQGIRRISLALFLLAMLLPLAACSALVRGSVECRPDTAVTTTSPTRMTYLFGLEQIPDGAVQPGATIAVWWHPVACPRTASQDQEAPAAVEVSIALYGPYLTQNEAEQARAALPAHPAKPSQTPAATNTPFGLSDTTR